jgi:hypothetical protein
VVVAVVVVAATLFFPAANIEVVVAGLAFDGVETVPSLSFLAFFFTASVSVALTLTLPLVSLS